ncbi:MAG TPA: hypothetical protein VJ902_02335 [Wenzhouxiangellaceae bacterium]|nr:hypothetical protein [Wenzhouxiangellaceae bacterium]
MLEALPAAFGFSFIFNFNFNFKTISPRADDGTMPGAAGLQSKPFRHALRACRRLTFVGCNKSKQKCALQAAAVGGAGWSG